MNVELFYFSPMKITSTCIILLLFVKAPQAQKLDIIWMPGEVVFSNGEIAQGALNINNKSVEGSLLVMEKGKVTVYGPTQVNGFILYDTLMRDTLVFESVKAKLHDYGTKKVFLERLSFGEKYSLYQNVIPSNYINSSARISVRIIDDRYASLYSDSQKAMVLMAKNGIAQQISTAKGKNPRKRKFKVEKYLLMEIFEDQADRMAAYIKENKLKIKRISDLILITEYANKL